MKHVGSLLVVLFIFFTSPCFGADSASNRQTQLEKLVLMPLRLSEGERNLQGPMETALVESLKSRYEVFSGERVSQKAREIFMKESRNTAKKECDETRCMQDIAMAFQAELIASVSVTKRSGGYFLALSIQNIFDNKVVESRSEPCKDCDEFELIEKMKSLASFSNDAAASDESERSNPARKKSRPSSIPTF